MDQFLESAKAEHIVPSVLSYRPPWQPLDDFYYFAKVLSTALLLRHPWYWDSEITAFTLP